MISVIIPCYNYSRYLGQAIEAIQRQTYSDWEILVIDDGSTDNTREVAEAYAKADSRVNYFFQTNAGPSAARNNGIARSAGSFIQFLDPDDLFEKRKFEVQLKVFEEHPEADVVYSSLRYFTRDAFDPADRKYSSWGVDKEWMPKLQGKGRDILTRALKGNFTHFSGMLFRRSIVLKAGKFDEVNNAPSDYTYILQCVIHGGYFFYDDTPDTFGLIRVHADNLSKNQSRMLQEEINARLELAPLFADNEEATHANEYAIRSYRLVLNRSWKRVFLSGGPFDFVKKIFRWLHLDKFVRKVFYRK